MPTKLITTIMNIGKKINNDTDREVVAEFYGYLTNIDASRQSFRNLLITIGLK
jgi:hypothetical protein